VTQASQHSRRVSRGPLLPFGLFLLPAGRTVGKRFPGWSKLWPWPCQCGAPIKQFKLINLQSRIREPIVSAVIWQQIETCPPTSPAKSRPRPVATNQLPHEFPHTPCWHVLVGYNGPSIKYLFFTPRQHFYALEKKARSPPDLTAEITVHPY
jgi:hypothetical protein